MYIKMIKSYFNVEVQITEDAWPKSDFRIQNQPKRSSKSLNKKSLRDIDSFETISTP